jgi:hypothetical protein
VQGAKIQDIIPFWPYKPQSLALLRFGTVYFAILDFFPFAIRKKKGI